MALLLICVHWTIEFYGSTLNAVIARAAESKQDNPEDITVSSPRLHKEAVLQTAKQIFIQNCFSQYEETAQAAIEAAEIWHTAQEEYINE